MWYDPGPRRRVHLIAAVTLAWAVGVAACGGDEETGEAPDRSLPAEAAAGRELARDQGCTACHGGDGQGGVGPAWVGLAGRTVDLDDGSSILADEAYLTRAIADPNAEIVDGYSLRMPGNDLDDEQIGQLVAYITALGDDGSTVPAGTDS